MEKEATKFFSGAKSVINKLDALFAKWAKAELEPLLYSVAGFSTVSSAAIIALAIVCHVLGVDEGINLIICSVGVVAMLGYIIKLLMPNIRRIKSILMKMLYIVFNLIAGIPVGYLFFIVIVIVSLYYGLKGKEDDDAEEEE